MAHNQTEFIVADGIEDGGSPVDGECVGTRELELRYGGGRSPALFC
jgi:hypothetical protein